MDKKTIHGESGFKKFISGRGFYVALAACLVAAGSIAAATFGEKLFVKQPAQENSSDVQGVEQPVSNLPDDRKTTTTTTTTTTKPTTPTTAAAADLYILPFGNTVQKAYSADAPVYSITMGDWRTHDGVDFEGKLSAEVKSLADGKVVAVGSDPLWGDTLDIDHGVGVVSHYCGVKAAVAVGDTVRVGQAVGTLSEIPCEISQKPHLHLELLVDGQRVDPVTALGREVRYVQEDQGSDN